MARHVNNGNCDKCHEIMNEFGTEDILRSSFILIQAKHNDCHVSWAGRGEVDQNRCYDQHQSNAKWGYSPHNFTPTLALDLFRLLDNGHAEWKVDWFRDVILVEMPGSITWGGTFTKPDSDHFEVADWKTRAKTLIWQRSE